MNERYHIPVLLKEVITFLEVQTGNKYIDATLGGGGYTFEIAKAGGQVLGIDVDKEAIEHVQKELTISNAQLGIETRITLARGNFKDIDTLAHSQNFNKVSGIVFDLGISSHHIDEAERGFSFQKEAILDMRMDQDLGVTAKDLVNGLSEKELANLFWKLGEEENSRKIARLIVEFRKQQLVFTTKELSEIIHTAYRGKPKRANLEAKVFQALRIAVNDELHSLEEGLLKAFSLLEVGGRIVVVSFHSLEDRIVKNTFLTLETEEKGRVIATEPVRPSDQEILENSRSRSAKMRVFEKS